jgi:hypothetical protein
VVDVRARQVFVHLHPLGGSYRSVTAYSRDERICPLAAPEAATRVGALLP